MGERTLNWKGCKCELGFKAQIRVHQEEEAEESGHGEGNGRVEGMEAQVHENIACFISEYSENHKEFRADGSNECFSDSAFHR